MAKIVGLPKLSPTMDEGVLVRWAKREGDAVEIDDLLAEVETDKATMEFRSFDAGTLLKILVPEGETLRPDAPVAVIGKKGDDIGALLSQVGGGAVASAPAAAPAAATASAPATAVAVSAPAAAAVPVASNVPVSSNGPGAPAGRTLASPLVRRLAREHDVALGTVVGSGPGGRIIKRDLETLLANPSADAVSASAAAKSVGTVPLTGAPAAESRVVKLTPMRRTIARRLTESKQQVPHFYLTVDLDADPLWQARQRINADLPKDVAKVSINDLVIKATAIALRRVPEVNASFTADSLVFHQRVDISVAVAIPDGLVTPVLRDADSLGVLEISSRVRELAQRARDRKLKPEEMADGTFSVSNLGMFGIENFAAVINPPEGAILAVGAVREEPVVRDGQVVAGRRMRVTLSVDHRVIDGAAGAKWLAVLRTLVESPIQMIL